MKKIDDIFKSKLDNEGFAYSEKAWNHMESLLEENTKKGLFWRKKNLGILILFLTLAFSLSYLTIKKANSSKEASIRNNNSTSSLKEQSNYTESLVAETLKGDNLDKNNLSTVPTTPVSANESSYTENALTKESLKLNNTKKYENIDNDLLANSVSNLMKLPKPGFKKNFNNSVDNSIEINSNRRNLGLQNASLLKQFKSNFIYLSADSINHLVVAKLAPVKKIVLSLSTYGEYLNYKMPIFRGPEAIQKSKESVNNTFNYGIKVSTQFKHFNVGLGLGFRNFSSTHNYTEQQGIYEYDTTLTLIRRDYIQNGSNGPIALLSQDIDSTEIGSQQITPCPNCQTRIGYLNIPLSIAYSFQTNKFVYFTDLGLNTNILTNRSGNYVSLVNNEVIINSLNNSKEIKSVNFDMRLAFGLKFKLTERFYTWGSFGKGLGLSSMTRTYQQKINYNFIQLGVEYRGKR